MATLQVLTLNVWGLWLVSKKRYNRILHLAEFLANDAPQKHNLDVVLLQEVWVDHDAQILISAARVGGLPYAVHFRSGVFGSGLLTLSRYPIIDTMFHQYSCAGDPLALSCGDFLAAKGVGWVRLRGPGGRLVDVFNTHLHANYSHKYDKRGAGTAAAAAAAGGGGGGAGAAGGGAAAAEAVAGGEVIPAAAVDEFAAFRMAQMVELCRWVQQVSALRA
ncbi:hypothetical protein Agub_g2723, partial [Astrephomene gubernaculifera]